jgi:serine/threonine protein kinase
MVTPQQWERISAVFREVSALPPDQRDAHLTDACPDEALRREVRTLLANHDPAGRFMEVDASIIGRSFRQYRIVEEIGHGSMGQVYKARDTILDRTVALKLLPLYVRTDARARQRLVREAKTASALNHPNIVTIHEIAHDEKEDVDFIVMEHVLGKTLAALIPPTGLSVERALDYAKQIAEALVAAHGASVLHGDLKPVNIMVTEQGHVKLLDFGLAKAPEQGDAAKSDLFGTTAYMAPERVGVRLTDPRSEVFSFGLILHQMVSGEHPFGAGTPEQMATAIRDTSPKPLPAGVPQWFAEIVSRCLEKRADDRFQSMRDLLIELRESDAGNPGDASARPARRITGDDVESVRAIAARISYSNVGRSRQSLKELADLLTPGVSRRVHDAVTSALKDILLTIDMDGNAPAGTVRKVRLLTLDTFKAVMAGDLSACFQDGDLEELDLFMMDFSGAQLTGVSFKGCFLAGSDFRNSTLIHASFGGAKIRNVDFTKANLSDADFTDADWFNALGLTERQLLQVRRGSLRPCPPDVEAMHRYLAAHYVLSFETWSSREQEQLKTAWNEYLRPGGLRKVVAERRLNS